MSQHQQVLVAGEITGVSHVAQRALSILAASGSAVLQQDGPPKTQRDEPCTQELAHRFYATLTVPDPKAMANAVRLLKQGGVTDEVIANDLVPNAARALGKAWEDDLISFSAVTIGCSRLQSVVRKLADQECENQVNSITSDLNFLIVTPQDAQHTLGAIILARQLRVAGARVQMELGSGLDALMTFPKIQQFDGIMISACKGEDTNDLRRLVVLCHRHWPDSKVFLGGAILEQGGDLAAETGTDYVTNDWHEAICLCT